MTDVDLTAVAEPVQEQAEQTLQTSEGISERPCEICGEPVNTDERHEILRAEGPVWRHDFHSEKV